MKELKAETINDIEKNILKISTKLFLDQGYDNTTIRQIAEASGIGRGHLYYYFRKKEDILIHIFKQILNKIYNDVIESSDDKTEVLLSYAMIQCIFTYTLVFNEKLFRIYLQVYKIENEEKNKMKSIDQIMEELDIDSIIKSIISTRLLLLNIINHQEVESIVNQAMIEAKKFDYNNIIEKIHYFDF